MIEPIVKRVQTDHGRKLALWMVAVFLLLLMAGCKTIVREVPVVQEVKVPVVQPCLKFADIPQPAPRRSNVELAKLSDFDLVVALHQERGALIVDTETVRALLRSCAR